ncbi:MAG TPA: ABC transporter permease, partial [Anaerolineales bacterium]|nr:ABC transporter permease [Anaerolineales bacterium]
RGTGRHPDARPDEPASVTARSAMSLIRLGSIIRKEFIQIARDPRTLYIVIAIPVVQLFLLGYTATTDVRNVPLVVLDLDRSPASRALLDAYRAADYFRLTADIDDDSDLRHLIDSGRAGAGLVIPPDYSERLLAGQTAHLAFVLDGSDPNVASTSLAAAQLIGQAHSMRITFDRIERRGLGGAVQSAVDVRAQVWYNPDLVSAYFMVPALIGLILQLLTTMLTATAVVRERERGTIEQLIVTPIRPIELIVGKITPYVLIAFFDTIEILVVGTFWFHVPIRGSLGLLLGLSGLFLVSSLGIGLVISTIARTQQEAMMLTWFTLLPTIFLSGFIFPLGAMPPLLRAISYGIPLRYYLTVIRSVLLKGVGVESLGLEIAALAAFGLITMSAAALRFRKRLD